MLPVNERPQGPLSPRTFQRKYGKNNSNESQDDIEPIDLQFAAGRESTAESISPPRRPKSKSRPWGEPCDEPLKVEEKVGWDGTAASRESRVNDVIERIAKSKSKSESPDVKCCLIKKDSGGRLPMHLQNITEGKRELVGRDAVRERLALLANRLPSSHPWKPKYTLSCFLGFNDSFEFVFVKYFNLSTHFFLSNVKKNRNSPRRSRSQSPAQRFTRENTRNERNLSRQNSPRFDPDRSRTSPDLDRGRGNRYSPKRSRRS